MTTRQIYEQHKDNGGAITLNGFAAEIVGWNNDFPTVTAETPHGRIGYEWSHAAIIRIIAKGGAFKS